MAANIFANVSWWATRREAWQAWLRSLSGTLFWSGCELGSRVLVHARSAYLRSALLREASLDKDQN